MGKWPSGPRGDKLVNLRESGASIEDLAKKAGVSYETARVHLTGIIPLEKLVDDLPVYPREMLSIEGDCAITSDWHAPYFSILWLKRLIAVSEKLGIRKLAIVGDLTDFKWLSHYMKLDARGGQGLKQELRVVASLLQLLLRSYDTVYWSMGNHEARMSAVLNQGNILPFLGELIARGEPGKLITTEHSSMLLNGTWRLEHPKSYSGNAAVVAAKLSSIFLKNVATAHGHHLGYKHDPSGEYLGIDLGGMFDTEKQEYLYLGGSTVLPAWNAGFWVYHRGKVDPFDDKLINWEEWDVE